MCQTKGGRIMPEFDLEQELAEFNKEWEESNQPEVEPEEVETEEVEDDEPEVEDLSEDEQELEQPEPEEDEEEQPEEVEDKPKKPQSKEENSAFAEMRRQNEALKKQAALVEKAAAKYGMTTEQYLAAVEEQEFKERAEKQGIPVDVLREQESLKKELDVIKQQAARDNYSATIRATQEKFTLEDEEINKVFSYLGENGFIGNYGVPTIPFEAAYKLANFEKLTAKTVKEEKQKDLAAKKARQKKSAVAHTNASTASNQDTDEIDDEFVSKKLEEMGIRI
jgi:hypothetical protein